PAGMPAVKPQWRLFTPHDDIERVLLSGDVDALEHLVLSERFERMNRNQRSRHWATNIDLIVPIARVAADHVPYFADRFLRRTIDHDAHRAFLGVMDHQHDGLHEVWIAKIP